MNSNTSEFLERIIVNNRTTWWKDLKSETNKNKGRCLQRTLEEELTEIPGYRSVDRRLFFFSTNKNSSIDGRYKSLGVEEKYNPLDLKEHLIDGSIHRGIVWVLGNPHNLSKPVEALSLYVLQDNTSPINYSDVDLYFPIVFSLAKLNINIAFINGLNGEHWVLDIKNLQNPLPKWLSEKEAPDIWDKKIDVVTPKNRNALNILQDSKELEKIEKVNKRLPNFGKTGDYQEIKISSESRIAIIDYGNEWRLIELGLILRSVGYDAVKVIYNKEKHKNKKDRLKDKIVAGMGVEKRVADNMLTRFSVLLDWGTES